MLDPTHVSIVDYVKRTTNGESFPSETVTPPLLAEQSESDSREVLDIVHALRKELTPETGAMECELDDLETWGYLGLYLADKLRAGVALQTYRTTGAAQEQQKAIALLQSASSHWAHLSQITDAHYHNVPHPAVETFSWSKYTDQVQRDIQIAQNG